MSFATVAVGRSLSRGMRSEVAPAGHLVVRNYLAYRRAWGYFVSGFFEPVLYLFSIGIGVGQLVTGFSFHGQEISYAAFVAPGMLAASAMNGAVMDATYNVFFKLKFEHFYDHVLATPMTTQDVARGEIAWAVLRGGIYSGVFLLVMVSMGLVGSWWALLVVPAALLIGFCFSGIGLALTTWMRSWQDFEFIQLAIMPMFLFSATFFPVTAYPEAIRWFVEITPLYRGVLLVRELSTGALSWGTLVSVVYLATLGLIGLRIASRRLGRLLLS
jgi:lipooligosaccharide transport system permease protein